MTSNIMPKYPEAVAKLSTSDGNVFALIGVCTSALREAGVPNSVRQDLVKEVMSASSYDEALRIMMKWVTVK